MKKKPIAVNILYTQTHKKSYPRQQMPTKQATDSSVSFPFTLSHTCIPNKTSFMQVKRVELTLSASSVGGENKNKTRNMKQTGQ